MPIEEPNNKFLRDTDWDLVVIGRGTSAIVNCITRKLSGKLPEKTLLVGLVDPWQSYADHSMGQHAPFLALPGYMEDAQTRDQAPDQFLSSRVFARNNQLQLLQLLKEGLFQVTCTAQDAFEFVGGKWLIPLTRGGESVTITSKLIDVCAGPGPGRVFQPGGGRVFGPWTDGIRDCFDTSLLQQLRDDSSESAMIAEKFMQLRQVSNRVLVVGEGPLAASVVEHALNCGADYVNWVGRPIEMANISFPPSMRYDDLVSDAGSVRRLYQHWFTEIEAGKPPKIQEVVQYMKPESDRLAISLGQISGVQRNSATVVGIPGIGAFDISSANQTAHSRGVPVTVRFDLLVISASSENSDSERRSAAHLLRSIPKAASPDAPLVPIERQGMFVGLQVPSGSLRVLGAASRNQSILEKLPRRVTACEEAYKKWYDSLSPQTQMPNYAMGITVASATIAGANEYYSAMNPDKCAQTALLSDGPLALHRKSTPLAISSTHPEIGSLEVFPRASQHDY
jgi:hypothetical protein